MSCTGASEPGEEDSGRVIDRTGDNDQRPLEERGSASPSNIVAFSGGVSRERNKPYSRTMHEQAGASPVPFQAASAEAHTAQNELSGVARRLQKELDAQFDRARAQLDAVERKIDAQEKRCIAPKLDAELQEIHFQRQKLLIANGPQLADALHEERNRLADLEQFKADHRLSREAHYPGSPVLGLGILFMLIIVEACVNGVFFAETSDQGLFGGWIEAFVLSLTNVGAAFLAGRLVLPQLNRRGIFSRLGAAAASAFSIGILIAVNIFGAHYRDYRAETANVEISDARHTQDRKPEKTILLTESKPASPGKSAQKFAEQSTEKANVAAAAIGRNQAVAGEVDHIQQKSRDGEREAIGRVLASPLNFKSFSSLFLLVIGFCGSTIAAWDGYKFDDPYPGYGRCHRRYIAARTKGAAALRRILAQANSIMGGNFQAIKRQIDSFAQELAALASLHHVYAGEWKRLGEALAEAARKAEGELEAYDRLANKVPGRDRAELHAIGVGQLPSLNESHVRFYETKDKQLKSLQKTALKEQSDVLGMLDTASAGFQKLLAEASEASLQAASRR